MQQLFILMLTGGAIGLKAAGLLSRVHIPFVTLTLTLTCCGARPCSSLRGCAQVSNYRQFAEARAAQLGRSFEELTDPDRSATVSGGAASSLPAFDRVLHICKSKQGCKRSEVFSPTSIPGPSLAFEVWSHLTFPPKPCHSKGLPPLTSEQPNRF